VRRSLAFAVKRAFDLGASAVLILFTSPVMALIAIAIKVDSRGPVFFRQQRAGLHGQPFRIFKFRTMVDGAEEDGPVLSMTDGRVTRLGRWLRVNSLDELPQLFNVFGGQMSLVGPRPQLMETTRPHETRRFEMRPGMTGPVKVSRRPLDWDERMVADLDYVDEWSLKLDFQILVRTIPVMFGREDALDLPRN
jgi:lipopolysaccharide/colanic/teichoic acid biosynthesis glycosyltransferase